MSGLGDDLRRPAMASSLRDLRVPWWTLIKLFAAGVVMWAVVKLWAPFELLLVAALFAVALSPLVDAMERRGVSRGWGVAVLAFAVLLLLAAFVAFVLPPLTNEMSSIWRGLPKMRETLSAQLDSHGLAARVLMPLADLPVSKEFDAWVSKPLEWGPAAAGALASGIFAVVLSLYLLLDGRKVVAWLMAYVPRRHRRKMSTMVPEVFDVLQAYTAGQLVTSLLFAVFTYLVLTLFRVPAALPLALIAAVCDVIPVVGILVATGAAAFCALTVSPSTALFVTCLYIAYHALETYLLVPKLYGNKMRLSTLTVLLALLAGVTLDGVIGAILALPIVAAFPVVEKYWLGSYLHPDSIEDHAALRDSDDNEDDHAAAVDAVLRGARPENPV